MTMTWTLKHPEVTLEHLGLVPYFIREDDPRPAAVQINERYAHGGGWSPMTGFVMLASGDMLYPAPEDPEEPDELIHLYAETKLRDETIRFYECAWCAIIQPDGSFEVSRLD